MNRRSSLKHIGFAPCLLFALLSSRAALADFATHAKQPGTMPGDTLVTGFYHTCMVDAGGDLWCWGHNEEGQLGHGGYVSTSKPYVKGPTLKDVVSVAAGGYHTCAIKRGGSVWCWGLEIWGEIGDGLPASEHVTKPTMVIGPGKPVDGQISARAISLGSHFSCALLRNGKVACWGAGDLGQTGLGWLVDKDAPTMQQSPENHDIIDISMGLAHGCAVRADGTAWCWGDDKYEQLGDGPSPPSSKKKNPVQVVDISHAIAISAGYDHGCVLERPGTMKCWGGNSLGDVGDGTTETRPSPVQVLGLPAPATSINAAYLNTCARLADGTLACWGYNFWGALGQGNFDDRHEPVLVPGLAGVAQPSAGGVGEHHCVSLASTEVKCWGFGMYGEIGDGTTEVKNPNPSKVVATGASTGLDMGGGAAHSCAMLQHGCVKCWGDGSSGQLGNGTTDDSLTPKPVSGLDDAVSLAATGSLHNCALRADGTVWCWGSNQYGQLGDGTTSPSSVPVKVNVPEPPTVFERLFVAVAIGHHHSCGVTAKLGQVYCWGLNGNGQLGDGTKIDRLQPVQVIESAGPAPLEGAVMVQAGASHTCALLSTGRAKCWGDNSYGQLGDGSVNPSLVADKDVAFAGGGGALTLAAGGFHNCAIRTDGRMQCWGLNTYGQLGTGSTSNSLVPKDVLAAGLLAVPLHPASLALGRLHTCVGWLPGGLYCWGRNQYGQVDHKSNDDAALPVSVAAGGFQFDAKYMGLGMYHSLGMPIGGVGVELVWADLGDLRSWGRNNDGQLGDGTTTDRNVSVIVQQATCLNAQQAQQEPPPEYEGSFFTYGPELEPYEHPFAVAVDDAPQGSVFASDTHAVRICRVEADGTGPLCWGSQCNLYDGYLGFPPGYGCVDPDGDGPLELGDGQLAKYAHGPDEW
ncbi:MAG: hypothetical protein HY744_21200, partial [Deltaproteobacteria bacterium]|nr:hypothetical protein [Deltaproteobacteria bacterium]